MALRDGATVIAGVRDGQQARARELGAEHVIVTDDPDAAAQIRAIASEGVNRISEVDLSSHIDLDAEVIATGGVICSYYSAADQPEIPYWTLGFADTTLRLLGSDDFRPAVKADAAAQLTDALIDGVCARGSPNAYRWRRSREPTSSSKKAPAAASSSTSRDPCRSLMLFARAQPTSLLLRLSDTQSGSQTNVARLATNRLP